MNEKLFNQWPHASDGQPEQAVRLETMGDFVAMAGICCSMLESYGIPCWTQRPSDGQVSFLYGGFSTAGVDIYVPASRVEEAKEIIKVAAQTAWEEDKEETP